jgi:hypothetical protein
MAKPPDSEEGFEHGGFLYLNVDRACSFLSEAGFKVIDPDVGTNLRDPIIHFTKP